MFKNNKIHSIKTDRKAYEAIFLFSGVSLLSAFMFEWFGGFEPCFLCWTQRFAMALIILCSIVFFIKPPKGRKLKATSYIATMLPALFGIGLAIRHLYIIKNPSESSCGFGPDMAFEMMPFKDAIAQFLKGGASCSEVDNILGLPFPAWALLVFTIIYFICLLMSLKSLLGEKVIKR